VVRCAGGVCVAVVGRQVVVVSRQSARELLQQAVVAGRKRRCQW